jgi:CheY-like chemotaxis protein
MSHQVGEYTRAGMDGHVAKPIDVEKLFAALEAALAAGGQVDDEVASLRA